MNFLSFLFSLCKETHYENREQPEREKERERAAQRERITEHDIAENEARRRQTERLQRVARGGKGVGAVQGIEVSVGDQLGAQPVGIARDKRRRKAER